MGCDGMFTKSPVCTAKKCPPAQNLEALAGPHPGKGAGNEAKYPLNAHWDDVSGTELPRRTLRMELTLSFKFTNLVTSPLVLPLATVCQAKLDST